MKSSRQQRRGSRRRRAGVSMPTSAKWLGLGGLIPFLGGGLLVWCPVEWMAEFGTHMLAVYGAVILSFLGGVRWGRLLGDEQRLARWAPLTLSVVPSLIAWVALLLPAAAGFSVLAIGLVLQYLIDRDATEAGLLPAWFGRLRLILSIGAVVSVLSGLTVVLLQG